MSKIQEILTELIEDSKTDQLDGEISKELGELYMKHKYRKDRKSKESEKKGGKNEEKETNKYLFLGWYIYNYILSGGG